MVEQGGHGVAVVRIALDGGAREGDLDDCYAGQQYAPLMDMDIGPA
ncbi:hypothetical protein [Streptomyces sp. SAS_276]